MSRADKGASCEGGLTVEVTDVVKGFDGNDERAIDGVSLRVDAGEFVTIAGPSGSGKSTLLHLIAALEAPTSGSIVVGGRDLAKGRHLDAYRRSQVGVVFQMHNLLPHLSAAQNVEIAMLGTHHSTASRLRRASEVLSIVGLDRLAEAKPPTMSGGERQRVAIARALVNEPPLLLADEPSSSLDPESTAMVLDLFRSRRDEHGVTLLLVSHNPVVIDAADRVVRMTNGRIVG